MRIIIDIDESRTPSSHHRKAVRIRTRFFRNAAAAWPFVAAWWLLNETDEDVEGGEGRF